MELLVHRDLVLEQLLVQHVDQDVARDVGAVDRARRTGGTERALRDAPVVEAREDGAHVLELVDVVRSLLAHDRDGVLVAEVVAALDVSNVCVSGLSSVALPSAALMPPSAEPEWERVGWSFETTATSAPARRASIAARIPARPAPTTTTSCLSTCFVLHWDRSGGPADRPAPCWVTLGSRTCSGTWSIARHSGRVRQRPSRAATPTLRRQ